MLIFIHPQSTPELAQALQGQRLAREHDRQPARHDDLPLAPHLRGHARPLPGVEDLLGARRRLPAVVRAALGPLPAASRPEHATPDVKLKKKPTEYLRTMYYDTLVFTSEMLRHLAAEVGLEPARDRHRSSDSVARGPGHPHHERARLQRRGAHRDAGRDRGEAARHQVGRAALRRPSGESRAPPPRHVADPCGAGARGGIRRARRAGPAAGEDRRRRRRARSAPSP